MKTIILVVMVYCLTISAQSKMTDKDLEGLKGKVKSVTIAYKITKNSRNLPPDNKIIKWAEYYFSPSGKFTHIIYPSTNSKLIYKEVDGFKTFKSVELKKKVEGDRDRGSFILGVDPDEKPIEEPQKITAPDSRFDQKYTYEYDSQGRIIAEREYLNTGKQTELRKFKYDDKNRLIEEYKNDTVAITKLIYIYDKNGNLIEELEDRDIKGAGVDSKYKTVYSEYKIDAQGNWIQRKKTWYFEVNSEPKVAESIYYRTITYY